MGTPTITNPKPTKAEVEFEGDCFGRLFSKKAPECGICLVSAQCRLVCKGLTPKKSSEESVSVSKENPMSTTTMEKEKTKKKTEEPKKLSKAYLKDKKNAGLRKNSAGWAVYQILREGLHERIFTTDELSNKSKVFCKEQKIKVNVDSKIPIMIKLFRDWGFIVKCGKSEYKKII